MVGAAVVAERRSTRDAFDSRWEYLHLDLGCEDRADSTTEFEGGCAGLSVYERPFLWVDNDHLLFPALPLGEQPSDMRVELQTQAIATDVWPKTPKGEDVTSSVLESGVPVDISKRPEGDLLSVDVRSGEEKIIAHGAAKSWSLSPDANSVAFTEVASVYLPRADEPLPFYSSSAAVVEVVRLNQGSGQLIQRIGHDVRIESLRWSVDGSSLAFLDYARSRSDPPRLYRVSLRTGKVTSNPTGAIDAGPLVREWSAIQWTSSKEILVFGGKRINGAAMDARSRRDWWRVNERGEATCLTAMLEEVPKQLWPVDGGRFFVGLAGQRIWRIDASNGKVINLTPNDEVRSISWPSTTNTGTDESPSARSLLPRDSFCRRR